MATMSILRECMGGPQDGLVVSCDLDASEVVVPTVRRPPLPLSGQPHYCVGEDGRLYYEATE